MPLQSFYFDWDVVALDHFAEFFKRQSHEECEHAEKLMKFQNRRGGRIILADIKKPEQAEWSNGLEMMQRALQMEKNVNQSLLDLHTLSTGRTDPHKPEQDEWSNGLEVMQRALQMEKNVNQSLLDLHKLATGRTDPHAK
uniref:ferritin heavy chain B-like n=1 Tax=Pristiophorus japonicus TaxID=55135 RepID=UPI00398F7BDF